MSNPAHPQTPWLPEHGESGAGASTGQQPGYGGAHGQARHVQQAQYTQNQPYGAQPWSQPNSSYLPTYQPQPEPQRWQPYPQPGMSHQHPNQPYYPPQNPQQQVPHGQPYYPWAHAALPATPADEPLRFHRLLRGMPKYAWYKPLCMLVVATILFFVFQIIITLVGVQLLITGDNLSFLDKIKLYEELDKHGDTGNPGFFAVQMLGVISMIPAVWLALLIFGAKPTGRALSVNLRLRWGLVWRTMLVALLSYGMLSAGLQMLAIFVKQNSGEKPAPVDGSTLIVSIILVLLLVPLQSAAEEYGFRGLVIQVFGSWTRNPLPAFVVSTALFVVAHYTYGAVGLFMVGVTGITAAYLSWRTGGLEAAIALHVINNVIVFLVLSTGLLGSTSQDEQLGSGTDLVTTLTVVAVITIVEHGLYVLAIEWMWRRGVRKHGWKNVRVEPSGPARHAQPAYPAPHGYYPQPQQPYLPQQQQPQPYPQNQPYPQQTQQQQYSGPEHDTPQGRQW
ncbi:MAG: CPBP family glutamic-type intramembrane protease [Microbacteriaceae bacterium]|nr:CPBP family glutamic-type intramembrane protease [Microbacteriaceae bacterium]